MPNALSECSSVHSKCRISHTRRYRRRKFDWRARGASARAGHALGRSHGIQRARRVAVGAGNAAPYPEPPISGCPLNTPISCFAAFCVIRISKGRPNTSRPTKVRTVGGVGFGRGSAFSPIISFIVSVCITIPPRVFMRARIALNCLRVRRGLPDARDEVVDNACLPCP